MKKPETLARFLITGLLAGLLLAVGAAGWAASRRAVSLYARMPEDGGWQPGSLKAVAGEPLHLRLTSDDVIHGFAIGQSDLPAVDVLPGQVTEISLTFDQPGTYTYYCTRWCGANHWRMRGTIEVSGEGPAQAAQPAPLYVRLGLDIDASRHAQVLPETKPSASRGRALAAKIPAEILDRLLERDTYLSHTPEQAWQALRAQQALKPLSDQQLWDLVALQWQSNTRPQALEEGQSLFAENCAACHGESGQGDGVFADQLATQPIPGAMPHSTGPTDFSDAALMLATSPAHLQGKILRGGMGTSMPYWGSIFSEEQTWALVAYLWTFQFEPEVQP